MHLEILESIFAFYFKLFNVKVNFLKNGNMKVTFFRVKTPGLVFKILLLFIIAILFTMHFSLLFIRHFVSVNN